MNHSFERVREVIEEVGRKIKARDEQALRFNFLKMLGRSDNELTHSRILAFLLDPSEHHGQGTRFLRSFIETFVDHNKLPQDLERVSVITEDVIGESGRLDILLCLPDGHWIVIENKVNAQEGHEQVERYMKFFEIQGEKVTLIFLTPKGSQPQNVSTSFDKNRIKCWSYNHLAKWLEHLQLSDRPMPDRLGVVLEQCRETWKIIYNPTVEGSMTDEILEYIRDPKNFAIAREIKESVGEIERSVCDTFWTMIQELLEKKLQESGHSHKWKVARTEKWIGIFWNAALAEENKFQFAVLFEKEKAEKVHYGIARGGQLKSALDPRDERLQSRLVVEDGFRPGGAYYTGVRNWMPSETSLLTLSEANQDKTHPIPRKLVNGLWSLFEKYRENLEDLNERYPENYPSRMSPKLGSQNNTP